ncbi:MAG TPA: T9SS type A sorting domain-containing protein, partial [Candidatus Cloacimonetes bacterium]|nr:T9SS type A sorting domain-containing protein [Candidatus Cloacimonadota bacterium]HEX37526.1 T9SS type A sorting domain-containing protein [Candidatus Cloacimonadota bacterium]
YRIRFPIETDWDYLGDLTNFSTSNSAVVNHRPLIFIYCTSNNFIDDEVVYDVSCVSVYPNPFSHTLTISFSTPHGYLQNRRLEIYNVQGQLIRKLDIGNENEIKWDGRDRYGNFVCNGLYLIRIERKDVNFIKKVLKL